MVLRPHHFKFQRSRGRLILWLGLRQTYLLEPPMHFGHLAQSKKYCLECVHSGAGEALDPEPVLTGRMVGHPDFEQFAITAVKQHYRRLQRAAVPTRGRIRHFSGNAT